MLCYYRVNYYLLECLLTMPLLSNHERVVLTRATMNHLDQWKLPEETVYCLLALAATGEALPLASFRDDVPFPSHPETLRRMEYLLRIADALRTTFPTSPQMGARWIHQSNRRLAGRSPLAVMLEGEAGLVAVLSHLDCSFAWDETARGSLS
ncbi:hypothetical protein CCP4SC76_5470008 [Gammaproteobacteria bacterium]